MGNEVVESQTQAQPQWVWVSNEKGVQIYKDKNGVLAQRRRVVILGNYALSQQNKVYEFRLNNQYGLVKCLQTVTVLPKEEKKQGIADLCRCANQKIQLDVFTERIAYRLSELPQLTFSQSLSFLKQVAVAYEVAYKKLGGLHINPQLIGVTEKGEIRAWVNQNWALNRPSHYIPILKCSAKHNGGINPQLRDQSEMISNLITVIQQKNQNGVFPSPFAQLLLSKSSNFRGLRRFLNEYIASNNIILPEKIKKDTIANPLYSYNNSIKNNTFLNPAYQNKVGIHSSQDSYDTQFQRVNQGQRPVFVNIPPFNQNKFSFNNQPNPIPIQNPPYLPLNYNSYNTTSSRPQLYNIQKEQINSFQRPFTPFTSNQAKFNTNVYSQSNRPVFNDLKFTLLPVFELGKQTKLNEDLAVNNHPLSFNRLAEGDEFRHKAVYKIADPPRDIPLS